jgi:hypothetical protein
MPAAKQNIENNPMQSSGFALLSAVAAMDYLSCQPHHAA